MTEDDRFVPSKHANGKRGLMIPILRFLQVNSRVWWATSPSSFLGSLYLGVICGIRGQLGFCLDSCLLVSIRGCSAALTAKNPSATVARIYVEVRKKPVSIEICKLR